MKIEIKHKTKNFESYRAERVKSLFNVDRADFWEYTADIAVEEDNWQIGLIVGGSGSGKTSIGERIFGGNKIYNPYDNWDNDKPIIDCIAPSTRNFEKVTGALSSVGLGDVPSWLKPFKSLSNGQQFRAGMARLIVDAPNEVVVDEFTSVVDRQIAKIGAMAFSKGWRKNNGKKIVLLSPHYDIVEWLQPDWCYNTNTQELKKKSKSKIVQKSNLKYSRQTQVTGVFLKSIII